MLPFTVTLRPGLSVHEQVVFAVKRAIVSGRLKPGDEFPSVRVLSRELRINPNTAHKVVATLIGEAMLEVRPAVMRAYNERLEAAFAGTVWEHCNSYFRAPSGKIVTQMPYDTRWYWRRTRVLRRRDFQTTSR